VDVLAKQIAKKYGSKPAKLIADFGKKYAFPIPASVMLTELKRSLHIYDVPSEYMALLPPAYVLASVAEYNPQLDPRSEAFDPESALQADGICTPFPVRSAWRLEMCAHFEKKKTTTTSPQTCFVCCCLSL
jgi:hypothetical protein